MVNWAHIMCSNISMHGYGIIHMIKEFASSPHVIIVLNRIHIDCFSASFLAMSHAILAYARRPCHIIRFVFWASHLLLLKVRSFLSIQMLHIVIPLSKNQILEHLLSEVGISCHKSHVANSTTYVVHFVLALLSWYSISIFWYSIEYK